MTKHNSLHPNIKMKKRINFSFTHSLTLSLTTPNFLTQQHNKLIPCQETKIHLMVILIMMRMQWQNKKDVSLSLRWFFNFQFWIPQSLMTTGWLGLLFVLGVDSIFFTTSIPSNTFPNTTCRPSSHGVSANVIKNWQNKYKHIYIFINTLSFNRMCVCGWVLVWWGWVNERWKKELLEIRLCQVLHLPLKEHLVLCASIWNSRLEIEFHKLIYHLFHLLSQNHHLQIIHHTHTNKKHTKKNTKNIRIIKTKNTTIFLKFYDLDLE